jgi:23S rRNA (guanosine2251-2'-O)-methyltransferase
MEPFQQVRHKPPVEPQTPRDLIVAVPEMQSHVNLSRIVRTCGCFGVKRLVTSGRPKLDPDIARDATDTVNVETHRTLAPALRKLKEQGYAIVGLEQTQRSEVLWEFSFPQKCVLLIGHERHGLTDELLALLDHAVEIPMYGTPHALNAAASADCAIYEYCRQHR